MARTIEVDEEQFLNNEKLRKTVANILAHPKAALLVEQAYKEVDPNAKTPRLDAHNTANGPVEEMNKKFAELTKQLADEKSERERQEKLNALNGKTEAGFARLRQAGVTQAGIDGVRKIMDENGILDPEIAWAYFEKMHPPQTPLTPSGGTGSWNFMDMSDDTSADLKKLVETKGQSEGLLDKMTRDALAEFRGQSRR